MKELITFIVFFGISALLSGIIFRNWVYVGNSLFFIGCLLLVKGVFCLPNFVWYWYIAAAAVGFLFSILLYKVAGFGRIIHLWGTCGVCFWVPLSCFKGFAYVLGPRYFPSGYGVWYGILCVLSFIAVFFLYRRIQKQRKNKIKSTTSLPIFLISGIFVLISAAYLFFMCIFYFQFTITVWLMIVLIVFLAALIMYLFYREDHNLPLLPRRKYKGWD